MKKAVLVFIFGLVVAVAAFAQGTPQTQSGDMALMFSINGFGNFGIDGNNVGTLPGGDSGSGGSSLLGPAMRFFLADNMGLRVGLGFNTSTETTTISDTMESSQTFTSFAIAPAIEIHLMQ
ncbi:MAG: hypothetical protein H7X80_04270, partial [bacterium]|nr:hypothetical protein [Candidatus Kapabacteria bacterium]